jgi:peptidoglycan/LPS O-acetylase OafA/YrhL
VEMTSRDEKRAAAANSDARIFHTLDALRGIAAIAVVVYHMQSHFQPIVVPGGYLAVDLFFIMSGVVLSHAYEERFRAGMGTLAFMRARFVRLYPLYLLGSVLGVGVTLASMFGRNVLGWDYASWVQAAVLAFLFLPNLSATPVNQLFPLNIPCWSLFLEVLVNLAFVLTWPLLTSRRLLVVAVISGASVVMAIIQHGNIDQGSTASTFLVGVARTVLGFSLGVLISRHLRGAVSHKNNLHFLAIGGAVAVLLAGGAVGVSRALWDAACVLALFPLLVWRAALVNPGPRLQNVATFLGVTSYAIYILHVPLSSGVDSATRQLSNHVGGLASAPLVGFVVLGLLLVGTWLVDRYFDVPIRQRLNLHW